MYLLLAGGFPRVLFSPCAVSPLWCFPPAMSGWGSVWVGLTPRLLSSMAAWSDQPSGVGTPDSGWQMSGHRGCATVTLSSTTPADTTAGTTAGRQHLHSIYIVYCCIV